MEEGEVIRSNFETKVIGTTGNKSLRRWLLFQPDDLLIEHYELFLHHHVFVVVSGEPVLQSAALLNLTEEGRYGIPLEQPVAECIPNAAGEQGG